jgi:hypothetical protein
MAGIMECYPDDFLKKYCIVRMHTNAHKISLTKEVIIDLRSSRLLRSVLC